MAEWVPWLRQSVLPDFGLRPVSPRGLPHHPYKRALPSAVPALDPEHMRDRIVYEAMYPVLRTEPSGCRFYPRCPTALPICRESIPRLRKIASAACLFAWPSPLSE